MTSLDHNKPYDAIIIGAGIIGSGIALALAKRGYRTLTIDKNPAAGYGSTSHSSAIIRTPYSTYAGCALAWESLHIWRNWQEFLEQQGESPLVKFHECGMLVIHDGDKSAIEASSEHLTRLAIPFERWAQDDIKQYMPGAQTRCYAPAKRPEDTNFGEPTGGHISDALWTPDAGYISDPSQAAVNMKEAAERFSASFVFNESIADILKSNGRVSGVRLASGKTLSAPIVINAAGPYSSVINQLAGVADEMSVQGRPMRQEVCHLPRPSALTDDNSDQVIVIDMDVGTYFRTEPGGSMLVGGTEPDCDPLEWLGDADDINPNPTEQWTAQAWRTAQRIPALEIPGQASGVVSAYDATEDWSPIYDKSNLGGFYMACGTSGNQFKNGPAAGELIAGLIDYVEKGNDHDKVPYEFTCSYTGNSIDTAAFSRLRKIHKTSGNVMG